MIRAALTTGLAGGLTAGLVAGLVAATPVAAADYASRTVAGWTVAASKDGAGCFLTRAFDVNGGTEVLLGLNTDGTNHLTLLNPNWSIEPQAVLSLTYRLSRGGYDDHRAIGMRSGGKRGFVATFERQFPTYFAASRALHVSRDKVPVARLDLAGSGAAVAELRRCVAAQQPRTAATDPGTAAETIPQDPFASDPKPRKKK